jgi:hypothetical protein
MHVVFRQNLGTIDAHKHGLDHKKCQIGMDADVSKEAAEVLLAAGVAVDAKQADEDELIVSWRNEQAKQAAARAAAGEEAAKVKAVAKAPEIKGVEEESPVANLNAAEAIEKISHMHKENLQKTADHDKRATVVDAAKKRLAAL